MWCRRRTFQKAFRPKPAIEAFSRRTNHQFTLVVLITEEEYLATKEFAKKNKHKLTSRRLEVIILRFEGMEYKEIANKLDYNYQVVGKLIAQFKREGLESYADLKYKSNYRNLTVKEEEEILSKFTERSEKGEVITVHDIRAEFEKQIGRKTRHGYIYDVLKRHNWRKAIPRPQHPNKATEEAISASKKLMPK